MFIFPAEDNFEFLKDFISYVKSYFSERGVIVQAGFKRCYYPLRVMFSFYKYLIDEDDKVKICGNFEFLIDNYYKIDETNNNVKYFIAMNIDINLSKIIYLKNYDFNWYNSSKLKQIKFINIYQTKDSYKKFVRIYGKYWLKM